MWNLFLLFKGEDAIEYGRAWQEGIKTLVAQIKSELVLIFTTVSYLLIKNHLVTLFINISEANIWAQEG